MSHVLVLGLVFPKLALRFHHHYYYDDDLISCKNITDTCNNFSPTKCTYKIGRLELSF